MSIPIPNPVNSRWSVRWHRRKVRTLNQFGLRMRQERQQRISTEESLRKIIPETLSSQCLSLTENSLCFHVLGEDLRVLCLTTQPASYFWNCWSAKSLQIRALIVLWQMLTGKEPGFGWPEEVKTWPSVSLPEGLTAGQKHAIIGEIRNKYMLLYAYYPQW